MAYLSVWPTLQHVLGLLSELYLERMGSEIDEHIFDRVLQHNIFLNKRIWIIRCICQTHCQLTKFTTRHMPFKTQFTALVNARALTDNASIKIIRITAATLGDINDLKHFWGRCIIIYFQIRSLGPWQRFIYMYIHIYIYILSINYCQIINTICNIGECDM